MNKIIISLVIVLLVSCNQPEKSKQVDSTFTQILIKEANTTPTVDIKEFTLITNNITKDSANAIEILKVKRNWPLAMQRKDSSLFEKILATSFTFRADGDFFNRNDYINDRIHGTWTIDTVRYENMVLQFFKDVAILTYRNTLNGTDKAGNPNIEHYSWADIYCREDNQWKILGSHLIEAKIEYLTK